MTDADAAHVILESLARELLQQKIRTHHALAGAINDEERREHAQQLMLLKERIEALQLAMAALAELP